MRMHAEVYGGERDVRCIPADESRSGNASVEERVGWRCIVIVHSKMTSAFEILDLTGHHGMVVTLIAPMFIRWSTSSHRQS